MSPDGVFTCPSCTAPIFLTDTFRLYEAIDDELGAGGILGYVTTAIEQLILVHFIRLILNTKPALLKEMMFIKDGPLAFFGQTANMHKPMRDLVRFLLLNHDINLAGLEKSGAFVEHAHEIAPLLSPGEAVLLTNDYIYRYIIPGKADPANPYGRTTYYGNKLIFKSRGEKLYVVTLPTSNVLCAPEAKDFPNLHQVLTNIEKLNCDMYDDSLIPVALVNKLVSLANHPSSRILQKFAVKSIVGRPFDLLPSPMVEGSMNLRSRGPGRQNQLQRVGREWHPEQANRLGERRVNRDRCEQRRHGSSVLLGCLDRPTGRQSVRDLLVPDSYNCWRSGQVAS